MIIMDISIQKTKNTNIVVDGQKEPLNNNTSWQYVMAFC
jgi:hypothetical protein